MPLSREAFAFEPEQMCTICCKGRLADTTSVCNASRTPRHARSAVGSKWALAAGSEKPLLAFVQGQQTLGRGLKRSATTRKRPQTFLCCLRPPANACTVTLVLQRIHNAYTCLRIARRFYPQSLKKVLQTPGRDLKLVFARAHLRMHALWLLPYSAYPMRTHVCTSYEAFTRSL